MCIEFYDVISQFEADRRAFIITINSFDTELTKDDRYKLYPTCGRLYPDGLASLSRADDYDQVRAVAEYYAVSLIAINDQYIDGIQVNCGIFVQKIILYYH